MRPHLHPLTASSAHPPSSRSSARRRQRARVSTYQPSTYSWICSTATLHPKTTTPCDVRSSTQDCCPCAPMHTRHLVQKYTPVPLHCFRSVTSNSCDAWAPPTHRARCDDPAAHAVPAEARRGSAQLANPGATPAACLRPGRCEPQGQLAWPVRDFLSLASGAVPTSTQRHTPQPQHGSGTWHRCRRQHISHCCDRGGATFYA